MAVAGGVFQQDRFAAGPDPPDFAHSQAARAETNHRDVTNRQSASEASEVPALAAKCKQRVCVGHISAGGHTSAAIAGFEQPDSGQGHVFLAG